MCLGIFVTLSVVGIVTSLNLFATRFDQVLEILEARAQDCEYMLFDTPGQIEGTLPPNPLDAHIFVARK
jgi:hypothetical protein